MPFIFQILILVFSFSMVGLAQSADIRLTKHDKTHSYFVSQIELELNGEISEGDTEKLLKILKSDKIKHSPSAVMTAKIFLNSQGGSYAEGVKLMRAFKEHTVSTFVRNGDTCLSACAIAFLGGTFVNEASIGVVRRIVQPQAKLGFHAPSLGFTGDRMVPASLMQKSYALALEAIGSIQSADRSFDIRPSLLQTIIATPPNQMYILKHVDDFARWNIEVEFADKGWRPTKQDVARWCMHYSYWKEGDKRIDKDDRNRMNYLVRFMEITTPANRRGQKSVFAHVIVDEEDLGLQCIAEIRTTQTGTFYFIYETSLRLEEAIKNIRNYSLAGNWVTRFHALPPKYEVSRLAK